MVVKRYFAAFFLQNKVIPTEWKRLFKALENTQCLGKIWQPTSIPQRYTWQKRERERISYSVHKDFRVISRPFSQVQSLIINQHEQKDPNFSPRYIPPYKSDHTAKIQAREKNITLAVVCYGNPMSPTVYRHHRLITHFPLPYLLYYLFSITNIIFILY